MGKALFLLLNLMVAKILCSEQCPAGSGAKVPPSTPFNTPLLSFLHRVNDILVRQLPSPSMHRHTSREKLRPLSSS